jgi:5-methylcytosine-specific restriction enzyme A
MYKRNHVKTVSGNSMSINPSTYSKVASALELFDTELRGADKWKGWESNKAHFHAIRFNGQNYPVKQVISMASGTPVSDFSGGWGGKTVAANSYAQELGFKIISIRHRNPTWSRDELIVTLNFYLQYRDKIPGQSSDEIEKLSGLLNRIGSQIHEIRGDDFRNPNGVYMKLMNFRGLDPMNEADGLKHGSGADLEVWEELGLFPEKCAALAHTITTAVNELEATDEANSKIEGFEFEAEEGKAVTRVHVRRERNRKIVNQKKKSAIKKHGHLSCEACDFRFDAFYGDRGASFIECHHAKPIHEMKSGEKTKLSDLILLCSNCHRMVHAKRPWLSLEELRELPGIQHKNAL